MARFASGVSTILLFSSSSQLWEVPTLGSGRARRESAGPRGHRGGGRDSHSCLFSLFSWRSWRGRDESVEMCFLSVPRVHKNDTSKREQEFCNGTNTTRKTSWSLLAEESGRKYDGA